MQATFSFTREDAENKFLPQYIDQGILAENPFESLDANGVGRLMKLAPRTGPIARLAAAQARLRCDAARSAQSATPAHVD